MFCADVPFNNGGLMSSRYFVALYGGNTCAGYKTALGKSKFAKRGTLPVTLLQSKAALADV